MNPIEHQLAIFCIFFGMTITLFFFVVAATSPELVASNFRYLRIRIFFFKARLRYYTTSYTKYYANLFIVTPVK